MHVDNQISREKPSKGLSVCKIKCLSLPDLQKSKMIHQEVNRKCLKTCTLYPFTTQ